MGCTHKDKTNCGCNSSPLTTSTSYTYGGENCPDGEQCEELYNAECITYTGENIVCGETILWTSGERLTGFLTNFVDYFCTTIVPYTVENVGGGAEVYQSQTGNTFYLRTITGDGVTVEQLADEIRLTVTPQVDYISNIELDDTDLIFTGIGNAFSGTIDLSSLITPPNVTNIYNADGQIINTSTSFSRNRRNINLLPSPDITGFGGTQLNFYNAGEKGGILLARNNPLPSNWGLFDVYDEIDMSSLSSSVSQRTTISASNDPILISANPSFYPSGYLTGISGWGGTTVPATNIFSITNQGVFSTISFAGPGNKITLAPFIENGIEIPGDETTRFSPGVIQLGPTTTGLITLQQTSSRPNAYIYINAVQSNILGAGPTPSNTNKNLGSNIWRTNSPALLRFRSNVSNVFLIDGQKNVERTFAPGVLGVNEQTHMIQSTYILMQNKVKDIESTTTLEIGEVKISNHEDSYFVTEGNFGIATKTPSAKLHLVGDLRIDDTLTGALGSFAESITINVNGTDYKLALYNI